jgi:hypothetical protein
LARAGHAARKRASARAASVEVAGTPHDEAPGEGDAPAAPRKPSRSRAPSTRATIARVERTLAREIERIETILAADVGHDGESGEAERRARMLASLARTLNEVLRLREEERRKKADDDDTVPRDLDEFRRELSRRLDLLVAEATTAHPGSS